MFQSQNRPSIASIAGRRRHGFGFCHQVCRRPAFYTASPKSHESPGKSYMRSGKHCKTKLPQRGLGQSPSRKRILTHLPLSKRISWQHLPATTVGTCRCIHVPWLSHCWRSPTLLRRATLEVSLEHKTSDAYVDTGHCR